MTWWQDHSGIASADFVSLAMTRRGSSPTQGETTRGSPCHCEGPFATCRSELSEEPHTAPGKLRPEAISEGWELFLASFRLVLKAP
jgi:hypothetical protein